MKSMKKLLVYAGLAASLIGCQSPVQNSLETRVNRSFGLEKPTISETVSHDCYLHLSIKEKKLGNKITFSLEEVSSKKGNYQHLVKIHYPIEPSSYILETYDSLGNLLSKYDLHTSRFRIAEDFSSDKPKGKTIELKESEIDTLINYDPKIETIKVNNQGKKSDLKINPKSLGCK